jgi:hypothetical protein
LIEEESAIIDGIGVTAFIFGGFQRETSIQPSLLRINHINPNI